MLPDDLPRNLYTLIDLLHKKGKFSDDRRKKMRSSAKCFAVDVHGKKSVEDLSSEDYLEPKAKRHEQIEDTLYMASPHKRRNVKQEIDQLLHLAVGEDLIPDPETMPQHEGDEPQFTWRKPPFPGPVPKRASENYYLVEEAYALKYPNFPTLLREEVDAWVAWVKPSTEAARPKSSEMRDTTIKGRIALMESYFGFLIRDGGWTLDTLSLEHMIDIGSLEAFVRWHSFKRVPGMTACTISAQADVTLGFAHSLANSYFNDQVAKTAIKAFHKQMGKSAAVRNKDLIVDGITIKMLYDAAFNEFPSHPSPNPGRDEHLAATRGLAMALFNVGPLRNQNYREAVLGRNIIRVAAPTATAPGKWKLFFTGAPGPARLKRHLNKDGSVNEYYADVPPDVCPMLDTYCDHYRPLVCQNDKEKTFFLKSTGKRLSIGELSIAIKTGFYRWLGRVLNPHILRDIISTETYESGGDVIYAAEIINDYPETFLARYLRCKLKEAQAYHHRRLASFRAPLPSETQRTKPLSDEELINAIRARGLTRQQVFGY